MPLGMFLGFVGLAVEQPFGRRQTNPGDFRSAFERADLGIHTYIADQNHFIYHIASL